MFLGSPQRQKQTPGKRSRTLVWFDSVTIIDMTRIQEQNCRHCSRHMVRPSLILMLLGIQFETKAGAFGFAVRHSNAAHPENHDSVQMLSHPLQHNIFSPSLLLDTPVGLEDGPVSSTFQNLLARLSSSSTSMIADAGIGDLPPILVIPGIFLLGAISAFVFANVVYTPEILENAEQIRLETREEEIRSVWNAVKQHVREGNDLEELRRPLEVALNMSIETYVQSIKNAQKNHEEEEKEGSTEFTEADIGLASLLDSKMLSLSKDD